jgi:hypothetical protein
MTPKEKKAAYDKIYFQKNKAKKAFQGKIWRKNNLERARKLNQKIIIKYRAKLKLAALIHYSANPPFCKCCGEKHIEFLSLDHIDGNGSEHRKTLPFKGSYIYLWVRKNNFPSIFQVLCFNCNFAKRVDNICPHQNPLYNR